MAVFARATPHNGVTGGILKGGVPPLVGVVGGAAPLVQRIALMILMDPAVASNWTVGTLVTEDTPSLKVSAPSPYRYSPVFAGESH